MLQSFADPANTRLPDGGPVYVETPLPGTALDRVIAEPWNTVTAALFIILPLFWLFFLRGRYRRFPFLVCCLPILLTGGIGGTLYHALRQYRTFFLMDVIPIYFLGLAVAIYLWIRLGPKFSHLIGMAAALAFCQLLAIFQLPTQWAVNISYACLATIILVPICVVMIRTRFRNAGWIYSGLIFFLIAWLCRIADKERPPLLENGTHWLWHVFGAFATTCLSVYLYWIEGKVASVSSHATQPGVPQE